MASAENNPSCVFCRIACKEQPTRILYEDAELIVFPDLKPAATHHYLIIPKNHIPNAKVLTHKDIALVERMLEVGKNVLEEKNADINKARFGFHWPPFCSIKHLHLHVISPSDGILTKYNLIGMFTPGSPWFATADYVLKRLHAMKST